MDIRRVYLDKEEENFCSSSLSNIGDFTYLHSYQNTNKYAGDEARGISFDQSGTKMYIGYSSGIDEYNLSDWDITTSILNNSKDLSNYPNLIGERLLSLAINESGSVLYIGGDTKTLNDYNVIAIIPFDIPWDTSSLLLDNSEYYIIGSGEDIKPYGVSVSRPSDNVISFCSPLSGHYTIYESIGFDQDETKTIFNNQASGIYDTFFHRKNNKNYILQKDFSDIYIAQYLYRNGWQQFIEKSGYFDLTIPQSGNIGDIENFYIDPYGENLYLLSTSGIVHQYISSGLHWYGTFDSGNTLENLFDRPKAGNLSVADYIDEGPVFPDYNSYWTSVDSGIALFQIYTEIPFIKNVSGISLEVSYNTLNSGMYIKNFQLYTNTLTSEKTLAVARGEIYDFSSINTFPSGVGTETFPLTVLTDYYFNTEGNINNNYISFELYSPESGNQITSLNLLYSGEIMPATGTGFFPLYMNCENNSIENIDLFIDGPHTYNSGLDLYIHNSYVNSGLDLFIQGHLQESGFVPLYTLAGTYFDNTDLFIHGNESLNSGLDLFLHGHETVSSSIPLYLFGHGQDSGIFPLYTIGQIPSSSNNTVSLYTRSTTNSELFNTVPLYIGIEGNPEPKYNLNLYLMGQLEGIETSTMPLYIYQDNVSTNNVDLFIQNNWVLSSGEIDLFIQGPSGTDGAIPRSGGMNLFIARDYEGTSETVPLYILGPYEKAEEFNMTIIGGNSGLLESINIYMHGAQPVNKTVKLFTKGL